MYMQSKIKIDVPVSDARSPNPPTLHISVICIAGKKSLL